MASGRQGTAWCSLPGPAPACRCCNHRQRAYFTPLLIMQVPKASGATVLPLPQHATGGTSRAPPRQPLLPTYLRTDAKLPGVACACPLQQPAGLSGGQGGRGVATRPLDAKIAGAGAIRGGAALQLRHQVGGSMAAVSARHQVAGLFWLSLACPDWAWLPGFSLGAHGQDGVMISRSSRQHCWLIVLFRPAGSCLCALTGMQQRWQHAPGSP